MFTRCWILISLLFTPFLTLAAIGLTAQNFYLDGSTRNVKLSWTPVSGATTYLVHRKTASSAYQVVARTNATSYDEYNIPAGPHTYKVSSLEPTIQTSNEFTRNPPANEALRNMKSYDNTKLSTFDIKSKIKLGQTYYQYQLTSDANGASGIVESSSGDGHTFSKQRVVLTRKEICGSGVGGFCKLESLSFLQHPKTSEVVLWAHWEEQHNYARGNVAVAFGRPGGSWKFGGSFRPLGHDSRDLTTFADDDGSAYLISSTRTNSDMNIYKLSEDWHEVKSLVTTVLKGESREAPAMIRENGIYYLFTSRAAGWYPSPGQYISSGSISGPWSESRFIGNLAGFAAQSGVVVKIGSSWVMCANQWPTTPQGPPHRQIILPITLANGHATYHFYPSLLYLDDDDKGGVYGVQNGKILSVGKKVSTSRHVSGHPADYAIQGINTDPKKFYKPPNCPFTFQIDLGGAYRLTQIELTTLLIGGSETAYKFTLEAGSSAQGPFQKILDESNNVQVGFIASSLTYLQPFQFVNLRVEKVVNMHNLHDDNSIGVHEFTVYGQSHS